MMYKRSAAFQKFYRHYISEPIIHLRGEEDITVWNELEGDEFEEAKDLLLNAFFKKPHRAYIKAMGLIKDERAIPMLKSLVENAQKDGIYEKLLSAKILSEWIGYDYLTLLENVCQDSDKNTKEFLYLFQYELLQDMDNEKREYFQRLLKS